MSAEERKDVIAFLLEEAEYDLRSHQLPIDSATKLKLVAERIRCGEHEGAASRQIRVIESEGYQPGCNVRCKPNAHWHKRLEGHRCPNACNHDEICIMDAGKCSRA